MRPRYAGLGDQRTRPTTPLRRRCEAPSAGNATSRFAQVRLIGLEGTGSGLSLPRPLQPRLREAHQRIATTEHLTHNHKLLAAVKPCSARAEEHGWNACVTQYRCVGPETHADRLGAASHGRRCLRERRGQFVAGGDFVGRTGEDEARRRAKIRIRCLQAGRSGLRAMRRIPPSRAARVRAPRAADGRWPRRDGRARHKPTCQGPLVQSRRRTRKGRRETAPAGRDPGPPRPAATCAMTTAARERADPAPRATLRSAGGRRARPFPRGWRLQVRAAMRNVANRSVTQSSAARRSRR